jgi:hypothetical protein
MPTSTPKRGPRTPKRKLASTKAAAPSKTARRAPAPPPKRAAHRPAYIPTDEHRRTVATMIGVGMAQDDVCKVLRISEKTLRRHYRTEIDTAHIKMVVRVRARLIAKADAGDTLCLIHAAKVLGWNDRLVVVDGGDEAAVATLTDAELEARIQRLQRTTTVARATRPAAPE